MQLECIKCLKAIMNNKVGLRAIFDNKEALTLIARSCSPNQHNVMQVRMLNVGCVRWK